jgi:hypothetical protein
VEHKILCSPLGTFVPTRAKLQAEPGVARCRGCRIAYRGD